MEVLKQMTHRGIMWLEKHVKTDMRYLLKNSFWVNANTIFSNGFAFILSIAFAHYVSKDQYGTYQFLLSIGSILGGMTLIGMNNAVTQAVARGNEGVFQESIREQLLFGFIPFGMGILGSLYYLLVGNQTLSLAIILIALFLPISNTFNTWTAFLSGKKEFKDLFLFTQIINIAYYGGVIITIFFVPYAIPLIAANFLLNTLANFLVYFLVIKKYKPRPDNDPDALSFGKKLSLSSLLPMIALNIDNLAIFHFLGPAPLAIYAFASNIPERLGGLLRPITTIAFPKFSERDPQEVAKTISHKTVQLFALALVGGCIYVVGAPLLFKILFPNYLLSVRYSQLYTIATVFSLTAGLPLTALFATRSKHIFTVNIAHPIFSIVTIVLGALQFGLLGVIIAKILSSIFLLLQTQYYSKKVS